MRKKNALLFLCDDNLPCSHITYLPKHRRCNVQTSTTSLAIVLRLEPVHRLILALLGRLYEKIYHPSGLN